MSYRENQNTHFVFSEYFPKILPFMRECGKNTKYIVVSAATVVSGTDIAYLVYNDGEPQGFDNNKKVLRNVCQEI